MTFYDTLLSFCLCLLPTPFSHHLLLFLPHSLVPSLCVTLDLLLVIPLPFAVFYAHPATSTDDHRLTTQ
jgi:hypothetical protein